MITGKWGGRLHCRTRVSTSELEAVLVACEGRYVGLECKSARDNVLVYFSKLDEEWQQNSTVLVDELVRMHEDQTEQEISPQQVASKDLAHSCAPCWHLSCHMNSRVDTLMVLGYAQGRHELPLPVPMNVDLLHPKP